MNQEKMIVTEFEFAIRKLLPSTFWMLCIITLISCGTDTSQNPVNGDFEHQDLGGSTIDGMSLFQTVFASSSHGMWLSPAEIALLPMSGTAWEKVKSVAKSDWGTAVISSIDNSHDVKVLAGALYAARTSDQDMRNKVIGGLKAAISGSINEHGDLILAFSRCLQTYVISADIIGYGEDDEFFEFFKPWIRKLLYYDYQGHSGIGVYGTAVKAANNWGSHARASTIASAIYLNDLTVLSKMTEVQKEYIGLPVTARNLVYKNTNWHATPLNKAGVNRKGSTIQGVSVDGALPEEMRRGGEFSITPTYTGYAWEGMQGNIVTAILLHRAGKLDIHSGDDAMKRSYSYLIKIGWKAEGDDTWQPYLANKFLGMSLPIGSARSGKNMGYTDWTHR